MCINQVHSKSSEPEDPDADVIDVVPLSTFPLFPPSSLPLKSLSFFLHVFKRMCVQT